MKRHLRFLLPTFFLVLTAIAWTAVADDSPKLSPGVTWQIYPDSKVSVAVFLDFSKHEIHTRNVITVYIRNDSNQSMIFAGVNGTNNEFEIDYLDAQNKMVPLRNYHLPVDAAMAPVRINPGAILVRSVELTADEMKTIKGRLIQCFPRVVYENLKPMIGPFITTPKILVP